MSSEGLGCGEEIRLKKRVRKTYDLRFRNYCRVKKYSRATGELLEHTDPKYNTMRTEGLNLVINTMTNSGTHASKHLDDTNTWLLVGEETPIVSTIKFNPPDNSTPVLTTETKGDPSAAILWEFHDDSVNVRADLDYVELWYLDPGDGEPTSTKINEITVSEGTKPADENWHWQIVFELYSTDTDMDDDGLVDILRCMVGQRSDHYDASNTWFRPFTSADSGLDSTGQNPDGAPTLAEDDPYTVTFVFTVVDGDYDGAWDKTEVGSGANYGAMRRLRYGGCKTDGSGCGTKAGGEEYEYTYVFTLAQGS